MNVVAMMLDGVAVWSAPGSSETQPSDENILRTQVWGLLSARSNLVFIFSSFNMYIVQCAHVYMRSDLVNVLPPLNICAHSLQLPLGDLARLSCGKKSTYLKFLRSLESYFCLFFRVMMIKTRVIYREAILMIKRPRGTLYGMEGGRVP